MGDNMYTSKRGLTTYAAMAAIGSLAMAAGQQTGAQMAVPNAEFHRFTPSTLRVEPETSQPEGAAPGLDAQAVTPEPPSRGFFREAPAAFDNRTNGFDPQGPSFDG